MAADRSDYRFLYAQEQINSQRTYDKTILTLSSGSFAISFAFLDSFVTGDPIHVYLVILGWVSLSASIFLQISSHFTSYHAFKQAVKDADKAIRTDDSNPGGIFSRATDWLNYLSAVTFGIGVMLVLYFVHLNFK